jgi:hypothetical protein
VDQETFNIDRLSAEEIIGIVQSDDVTAEQLDLLAAHTLHRNRQLQQQVEALGKITSQIERRLKELKGR